MTTAPAPRRGLRNTAVVVLALVLCVALAGCWPLSSGGGLTVHATFDDVADMANGAPVDYLDVRVGSVTKIALSPDHQHAALTLSIDRSAKVPAAVTAEIRRTTPLGERFVSLEAVKGAPATPLLADGSTIAKTTVVPDIQDLVLSGTDLFGALSASQIGVLLDEGAKAFGGKGSEIHQTLSDLDTIISGYAAHTSDISGVINNIDQLAATLAPSSQANAALFTNLAQTTQILNDQADRFLDLVNRLTNLARVGNSILAAHFDDITTQINGLTVLTRALASQQQALGQVLYYLPRHNTGLASGVNDNFVNLFADIILCGVPGGGSIPGSAASSCSGTVNDPQAMLSPRGPNQKVPQP
jgi:phospholipid/cholesterol/gamma-HCH transport system substrate-binding protein